MGFSRFAIVIFAGMFAMGASAARAADYRWLNSWDRTLPQISLFVEPCIKAVEAA